jgi:hypothetical protein
MKPLIEGTQNLVPFFGTIQSGLLS